ncbi:MAG: response regulator [Desulfobacter sp.]|nr:response regulator [Desulfobacter sp.]
MKDQIGKTMVVGAGVSGIRSALDLAQAGFDVILVDRSDHAGGLLTQLDYQFPTSSCGLCRMLPMTERDKSSQHCLRRGLAHEKLEVCLSCDLISLQGEPGNFTAALNLGALSVDPGKCMGCGICEQVCPVDMADPFNQGFTQCKAIHPPLPQSFANAWTIDARACTRCGACEQACPTQAIHLIAPDRAGFRILVVDDEAIVRDSMTEWLSLEGYNVHSAESGRQALELMESLDFQIMLTDIKMPGMDGVALLGHARTMMPELVVIMMTAYAEVDSAVTAMKEGALDYVTKPFEPEKVIAMVEKVYEKFRMAHASIREVDAVVLAMGAGFYSPDQDKNIYGYKTIPGVVTAMEFERSLSHTGPEVFPAARLPVKRIAWFQCVGSRDRENGFCSSVCCMISIKQALLAFQKNPDLETADIFYMDLRTFGKDFDTYKETALEQGVGFIRARVHSVAPCLEGDTCGITVRYAVLDGRILEKEFDMVVLANGQKQDFRSKKMIDDLSLETNPWGFIDPPWSEPDHTSRPGIFSCGGLAGLKDIETSVTLGSAAAMSAMETMTGAGRTSKKAKATIHDDSSVRADEGQSPMSGDFKRSAPKIFVLVCPCTRFLGKNLDKDEILARVKKDTAIDAVEMMDDLCSPDAWEKALSTIEKSSANRLVIGGCPFLISKERRAMAGQAAGLPLHLVKGLDILGMAGRLGPTKEKIKANELVQKLNPELARGICRVSSQLKSADPVLTPADPFFDRALVVGGGIAGLSCAKAIADSGFHVDLVEKSPRLGGNLSWIRQAQGGDDTSQFLNTLVEDLTAHDRVSIHLSSQVTDSSGLSGRWVTIVQDENETPVRVDHGVTILATGGHEADPVQEYPGDVYTQKAFDLGVEAQTIDPESMDCLVMIQCHGCRQKDKNYCSRVCCAHSLDRALDLKTKFSDLQIYIFYRDMMTPGFLEAYYTRAREAGVVFIPYDKETAPQILADDQGLPRVTCHDPILDRDLEIDASAVVLATGVVPELSSSLAQRYTAQKDEFGFFKAADPKFRPVDGLHPRVFACGLCIRPCFLGEAVAMARAVAARAVGILSGSSGGAAARVRQAYCSLCLACISACPFNARAVDPEIKKIVVDAVACQGCGICAAVCPSKAAQVDGIEEQHYLNVIDGVLTL